MQVRWANAAQDDQAMLAALRPYRRQLENRDAQSQRRRRRRSQTRPTHRRASSSPACPAPSRAGARRRSYAAAGMRRAAEAVARRPSTSGSRPDRPASCRWAEAPAAHVSNAAAHADPAASAGSVPLLAQHSEAKRWPRTPSARQRLAAQRRQPIEQARGRRSCRGGAALARPEAARLGPVRLPSALDREAEAQEKARCP